MNHQSRTWALQEAKAKFSEVVRLAQTEGPQIVTVHGQEAVTITKANPKSNALSGLSAGAFLRSLQVGPAIDFDIPNWETEGDFRDIEL